MMIRAVFLMLTVALGLVHTAASQAFDKRPSVIALFGDSITVGENATSYYTECQLIGTPPLFRPGFGLGRNNFCTPDKQLERILIESERPAIVVNHGIGGTSSLSGVERIASSLSQTRAELPDGKNYYVLVFYGTNDVRAGVPPSAIGANIGSMIVQARSLGWIPVIGNLLPRSGPSVSAANAHIQAEADARGAAFVDQFSNYQAQGGIGLHDNEDFLFNTFLRLHPSKTGYQIVAQQWVDGALSQLIEPIPDTAFIASVINLILDDEE